jgi:hypothetical protein
MAAPVGNQNAKRAAKWRDALERALSARDGDKPGSTLFHIADRAIGEALAGDKDARAEIANRLDGKPAQSVTLGNEDGEPFKVQGIVDLVRPG